MEANRKLKALQIITALGMGGAETWLMEILRLWSKRGAGHIDFLLTGGEPAIFDDEARQLGAKLHYVKYSRAQLFRFSREFRRILRDGRYDAVHDHQDYVSGWHYLIGSGLLPPVRVTHVHNPSYQIPNNYGVTGLRRITARVGSCLVAHYATHITGTSRQVVVEYGFDKPLFRHIPKAALHCGFDPARFLGDIGAAKVSICSELGWPKDVKIILFAGRMDQSPDLGHSQNHKNSGFAVTVGIECARRDDRVRMLFAGAPSASNSILLERIEAAGCAKRIQLLGVRTDIERLMVGSDVLLFPSRGEGLGMVAVEAQAAGLPVLASTEVPRECVVVPELVRFQKVDAGAEIWVDDLLELLTQPRNIQSSNQRVAASAFAIENSAQSLMRLYSKGILA